MNTVEKPAPKTISMDLAETLYELYDGQQEDGWTRVCEQSHGARRWQERRTLVIQDPEGYYWGFSYDIGLTENQDNDMPWDRNWKGEVKETLELFPLKPYEKTIVEYR